MLIWLRRIGNTARDADHDHRLQVGKVIQHLAGADRCRVVAQCRSALQGAFVLIDGAVQKDHGVIDVVVRQIEAV